MEGGGEFGERKMGGWLMYVGLMRIKLGVGLGAESLGFYNESLGFQPFDGLDSMIL